MKKYELWLKTVEIENFMKSEISHVFCLILCS